jgi:hypothetical protein
MVAGYLIDEMEIYCLQELEGFPRLSPELLDKSDIKNLL